MSPDAIINIIGSVTALVIALTALWRAAKGNTAVADGVSSLKIDLNGRLKQLLDEATARARVEGHIEGSEKERARRNEPPVFAIMAAAPPPAPAPVSPPVAVPVPIVPSVSDAPPAPPVPPS